MRAAQLIHFTAALALGAAIGCSRAETEQQTQRAAADVKAAAARAGDTLADGWLTTRIQAQFFADKQVKARYIDVNTSDGVVTIKGFVETPAAHDRALQIAKATSGVREVKDEILIGQAPAQFEARRPVATTGDVPPANPTAAPVDDERLTSSVQASFFLDPTVKGRQIDVASQNGVITLRGEVASEAERGQALVLARNINGVQRVEDNLTVNAALAAPSAVEAAPTAAPALMDDAAVLADVKARLAADRQLAGVEVNVQGGVLELRGTVPSTAARQRAVDLVRQSNGVTQVVDRLTLKR